MPIDNGPIVPRCHAPWQQLMIDANGNVHPCAYRNNYNNPSPHGPCGNVNRQSLQEIWNGQEYQDLRENMAKGDLKAAGCANCLALKQGQPLHLQLDADADQENPPLSAYARNLQLKRQEVARGAGILKSLPTVVFFTPTHHCNLRCVHCYQDPARNLSLTRKEASEEVLGLLPVLDQIVAGGGEPLLLPIWKRFIESADLAVNPYLEFATTTNATRLSSEILEGLTRFKRLALTVSLDGGTKEVFEAIRLRGKFEEVVANIDRLVTLTRGRERAALSVTISVMKANIRGLPDLVRFCAARQIGYNLLPVIAYPIDQSLRCFNDPQRQTEGWRDSLAESRRLFESLIRQGYPMDEKLADLYRGHFSALEGHIPWDLATSCSLRVRGRVPEELLKRYRDHKGPELLVGFFPVRADGRLECLHYSPLNGEEYEVSVSAGQYLIGIFPRNMFPAIQERFVVQVNPRGQVQTHLGGPPPPQRFLASCKRKVTPIIQAAWRRLKTAAALS